MDFISETVARLQEYTSRKETAASLEKKLANNHAARRNELELYLEETKLWLRVMNRALSALTEDEFLVLYRMYINRERNSIDRLCDELGLSDRRSVYKRRDRALRHLTIMLYGVTER